MARIPSIWSRAACAAAALALASLAWPGALRAACTAVPVVEKAPDPAATRLGSPADSPADVLDRPARAWTFDRWVDTKPLTLESLRGKVVLIRWFNTGCKYCSHTLPALETLRTRYGSQGLVVVGVYHPKPIGKVSDAFVRKTAHELGFNGPIAVDEQWSTLNRWWLDGHPDRNWTSVSFLLDRNGIVRWAHGGGEYHPSADPRHASCDASYAELERTLRRLLDDRAAAR
jgi:thiol-disulfide isomerase/thioredoxin